MSPTKVSGNENSPFSMLLKFHQIILSRFLPTKYRDFSWRGNRIQCSECRYWPQKFQVPKLRIFPGSKNSNFQFECLSCAHPKMRGVELRKISVSLCVVTLRGAGLILPPSRYSRSRSLMKPFRPSPNECFFSSRNGACPTIEFILPRLRCLLPPRCPPPRSPRPRPLFIRTQKQHSMRLLNSTLTIPGHPVRFHRVSKYYFDFSFHFFIYRHLRLFYCLVFLWVASQNHSALFRENSKNTK